LVSDDYQAHVHMLEGTEERDADELISVVGSHAEAFSEVEYELHEVISHNGCVAVRATMHASHEETGRDGEIDGIAILRFDGDRIAEEWSSWDYLGLAGQLGLVESASARFDDHPAGDSDSTATASRPYQRERVI